MTADHEPRTSAANTPTEAILANRLTAIADHHTPSPDWSDIVARAEGPQMVPLRRVGSSDGASKGRVRPTGRALAVAAVIVVVVAAVGTVMAGREDGEKETVAGPPADPSDRAPATGWYIPNPMPEGWTVKAIDIRGGMMVTLPSRFAIWTSPDGSAAMTYSSRSGEEATELTGERLDIGGGVTAFRAQGPADRGVIRWREDGQLRSVHGVNLPDREMDLAARAMVEEPGREDSPVEGLELFESWDNDGASRKIHTVAVTLTSDGGHDVAYELSTSGTMAPLVLGGSIPTERHVAGQPRPLVQPVSSGRDPDVYRQYVGLWSGADLRVDVSTELNPGKPISPRYDVDELIASLSAATTEEWRDFVRSGGIEVDDRLLSADRLDDVSHSRDADDSTNLSTTTDPTVSPSVWTTLDPDPSSICCLGPSSGEQTTLTSRWAPASRTQLDDISQLDFTLTLDRAEVVSGSRLRAVLQVSNPTEDSVEIHECTFASVATGLVSPDSTESLPLPALTDCYRTPKLSIPHGATLAWPLALSGPGEIPAREVVDQNASLIPGGTLSPGEYLAAADLPGSTGTVRVAVPVTVTPHHCGGLDGSFIGRYQPGSLAEAKVQAAQDGMDLRVVVEDGVGLLVTDDLRCDRVNVEISNGRVLWVDVG